MPSGSGSPRSLEHYPPGHVIFCERHGGPMPDIMYREVNGNEYTEG